MEKTIEIPAFSVPIFPTLKLDIRVRVIFDTKKIKDAYILAETKFCKIEMINRYKSINEKERKDSWDKLQIKRTQFAKSQNYAPFMGNKLIWVQKEPEPVSVA